MGEKKGLSAEGDSAFACCRHEVQIALGGPRFFFFKRDHCFPYSLGEPGKEEEERYYTIVFLILWGNQEKRYLCYGYTNEGSLALSYPNPRHRLSLKGKVN